MSKLQFWLLNAASAVLCLLLITHLIVLRANVAERRNFESNQQLIQTARQGELMLQSLAIRIAAGGAQDPRLRTLLVRHGIEVPPQSEQPSSTLSQ
jgi:hypothetical protein